MRDLKRLGDSQITKMHKMRNRHNRQQFSTADLIGIGLCMFTALYVAVRAY